MHFHALSSGPVREPLQLPIVGDIRNVGEWHHAATRRHTDLDAFGALLPFANSGCAFLLNFGITGHEEWIGTIGLSEVLVCAG